MADVRGLLRKPIATTIVQKMNNGFLQPGEAKQLIEQVCNVQYLPVDSHDCAEFPREGIP